MNAAQEMYIEESVEYLNNLLKYDKKGYLTEDDVKGQILYTINHLKKALK